MNVPGRRGTGAPCNHSAQSRLQQNIARRFASRAALVYGLWNLRRYAALGTRKREASDG